jgi:hypothetical protein
LRGFLGLFERAVIIVRSLAVTPVWLRYLFLHGSVTDISLFFIVKCALELWLVFNFVRAARAFSSNKSAMLEAVTDEVVTDICCICRQMPTDPVRLTCNHILCHQCVEEWLSRKAACPMCRAPVLERKVIEFADGSLPHSVFFAAF